MILSRNIRGVSLTGLRVNDVVTQRRQRSLEPSQWLPGAQAIKCFIFLFFFLQRIAKACMISSPANSCQAHRDPLTCQWISSKVAQESWEQVTLNWLQSQINFTCQNKCKKKSKNLPLVQADAIIVFRISKENQYWKGKFQGTRPGKAALCMQDFPYGCFLAHVLLWEESQW